MPYVSLDYETYSPVPIKHGAYKYASHPDADIICASMCHSANPSDVFSWIPGDQLPEWFLLHAESGGEIRAYNAAFEWVIWNKIAIAKYKWPVVRRDQFHCTAAQAAAMATPRRLDHVGEFLGLSEVKDTVGKQSMMRLSKPAKDGLRPVPKPGELETVRSYCDQDVRSEMAVSQNLRASQDIERPVYLFDQEINARGIYADLEFAKCASELWRRYEASESDKIKKITGGIGGSQAKKLAEWVTSRGVPCKSLAKPALATLLDGELPDDVRQVLEIRREIGSSAVKKFQSFLDCAEDDSRIRGTQLYHGASTGRFSGRMIQPHNMMRGILKPDEIPTAMQLVKGSNIQAMRLIWGGIGDVLGSLVRPTIQAAPGYKIIASDFASVEARCAAWLAGQSDLIDAFTHNKDAYVKMASKVFTVPEEKIDKHQRFIGKSLVLGCGFGMGGKKFRESVALQGVDISSDFAGTCVRIYRRANRAISSHWRELNSKFCEAINNKGKLVRLANGRVSFIRHDDWVFANLPSGRQLAYYKPQCDDEENIKFQGVGKNDRAIVEHTYGGKLLENLCSAICRDLLVSAMFRLEKAGYRIILTVHDEIICEVPSDFGSYQEVEQIMRITPSWADGFPVGCEGWEGKYYRK